MQNVYWFLIDGLSPQHLSLCGNKEVEPNFFDELLSKGVVFSQVISASGGTHTSMHATFSSFMPSVNGATGWIIQTYRKFDRALFTIADYFKLSGYQTYFYCDAEEERVVPTSGFDVWETSGYTIGECLDKTDMMSTVRRERFISEVVSEKKPKFVYHHNLLLHELNGRLGNCWPHEKYEKNIEIVANNFRQLLQAYHVTDEDVIIISSDHGVTLDRDYLEEGRKYGERQSEESAICMWSIIGKHDLTPKILPNMISALDIAPTLVHLLLNKNIPTQGTDRYEYIKDNVYHPRPCFREKGTFCNKEKRNPFYSDVFYVRDEQWKYVYSLTDSRSEWLMNLQNDNDYYKNLKDSYPELCQEYREMININIKEYDWRNRYAQAGISKKEVMMNSVKFEYSLVFCGVLSDETLDTLLDFAGPYYELILDASSLTKNQMVKCKEDYRIKLIDEVSSKKLLNVCNGEYFIILQKNVAYADYFLSDVHRYLKCHEVKASKLGQAGYLIKRDECIDLTDAYLQSIEGKIEKGWLRIEASERIIIFGAGNNAAQVTRYFGEKNIRYYCDNDKAKIGKTMNRKIVLSPNQLAELPRIYPVVVAPYGSLGEEIIQQLIEMDIKKYIRWPDVVREQLSVNDLMAM